MLHFAHRRREAMKDRARNNGVPDVELHDRLDRGNRLHVVIVQTMSGMHSETEASSLSCRLLDAMQLGATLTALGFQTILSSFFMSVLGMARR